MGLSIKAKITEDRDTIALLGKVEIGLRGKLSSKARKAAMQIPAKRARQLCRRGDATGTTQLLSAKSKAKRGAAKPLAETIRVVDREQYATTVMGPEYPAGAHGHLVELGHDGVYWGRPGDRVKPYPFMRPAVDETMQQQQQVLAETLIKGVEEEVGGG